MGRRWAIYATTNPAVLRVHVVHELTNRTILTSPPAEVSPPLVGLLELDAVRTIDMHRYRVRVNLRPGADRDETAEHVHDILAAGWGESTTLDPDPGPRAFEVRHVGPRAVAESAEMAFGDRVLETVFGVEGVSEAIAGDGLVLITLGRLFRWSEVESSVAAALDVV